MKHINQRFLKIIFSVCTMLACTQVFAGLDEDINRLQQDWAVANYQLNDNLQEAAFEQLTTDALSVTQAYPEAAEAWIWSGIIKSTFAGIKGGLGALSLVKDARADLERAMELNPDALDGSAYTSLGALYYSVPGWPVGFGDDDYAEELLQHALDLNPDGIDSNYFYASYLISERRHDEAREYLLKAQQARPRPGRELADAGRQEEIAGLLADLAGD